MAESALNIAMETIRDLLTKESRLLHRVGVELEEIEKGLMRMKAFLQYADGKEDKDELIHNRVEETRKMSEEVVGVLETFALKVQRRQMGGVKKAPKRFSFIFNEHKTLQSQIVSIKTKITNLSNSFDFEIYHIEQGQSSVSASKHRNSFRRSYTHLEEGLVGVENDVRILVDQLVDEENKCHVVSICGMGGLGKTSLARKVFNHDDVRRCFDLFAWVYINEQCQTKDVLQQILIGLVPQERSEIMEMRDEEQLVEKLYEVQQKKKYLVVIDDIWSMETWHKLRLGKTQKRSKVLLTTRMRDVALHADPTGFIYMPRLLNEEDSWDLLQKIAFGRRYSETDFTIDPRMEELGSEMLGLCRGLPLAVKVLGGILLWKQTHAEWEKVLQDLRNIIESPYKEIIYVLDLSYNILPNQLKQCFLFFGKFPDNFEMKATRIYHLWIAEGIVSVDRQEQEETMLDVAKRYLDELAQRCIVQVHVKEASTARRYKSCSLHDLMRDLCLSKFKSRNTTKMQGHYYYYNSDQHDSDDDGDLADQRDRHVRSLVILNGGEEFWVKTKPNLNNFQLLRVLDLEGVEINGGNLQESIGNLVQLRYLSLRCTSSSLGFWELPSSISNLRYLQILDLRTTYPLLIPDVLFKLKRLTHLYLPTRIDCDREKVNKLRLGGLSKLETLVNFNLNYCHVEDLKSLTNLRKLKAEVWEGFESMCDLVNIITSAKTLLKESKLKIMGFRFLLKKDLESLNKLLGCHHLCNLYLQGPIKTFPGHDHFSKSLTELNLWESRLEDDPMLTLEKLPSLFSLHIGRDVFMGNEMVCSPGGFPQLRTLVLVGLPNLVNWDVNKGAFPKLSLVKIHSCEKLDMIPDGLKFVATLSEVCIHYMPEEFEFRNKAKVAKEKQAEDSHKVRRNPTITYYNTVRPLDRTRMERAGPKKDGKLIEQASAETIDPICEVPESSQTVLIFREHGSTETIRPDGHGCVQTLWLGPSPTDIFSKPSRQYDAIRRTNEVQAAKIEKMEAEIKLMKEKNDLMEKEVKNLKNLMLSHDNMTDLPLDANTNSRQVPDASSAHQPRLAAEVEPRH